VRLAPTDLDWSHGSGPEITGPAEAMLMAITGRASAIGELAGPGQPVVARRLTAAVHQHGAGQDRRK
jgi:hypothetical protein